MNGLGTNGETLTVTVSDENGAQIYKNYSDEELAERKKSMPILRKENITGYLKRYAQQVSSADKGAIINK